METENHKLDLEIVKGFMDKRYWLTYVDYRDSLNDHPEILQKCIDEGCGDYLFEQIDAWYMDSNLKAIKEILDELMQKCSQAGYSEELIESFIEKERESIIDCIYERNDSNTLKDICRNTSEIPVRIELHSNYDCINSHHFESQGGYGYETTYFGDMVDALRLNPAKVKKMLLDHSEKNYGRFPDKGYRNGKELVSYDDFYRELENSCCGANLLVFIGKIKIHDLLKTDFKINRVTIPKGNPCGLFSSTYGGGSLLEMDLQQDITLKLYAKKYDYYSLKLDYPRGSYDYCVKATYGVCDSFFKNKIKISA